MALYGDTDGSYAKKFNFGTDINLNLDWDIRWVKGLKGVFWGNYRLGSSRDKKWTRYVPTYNEDGTEVTASKLNCLKLKDTVGFMSSMPV